MDKTLTAHIKVEKNGHTFYFLLPIGAPIGSAYDAAFEILEDILAMAKEAQQKAALKKEEIVVES